MDGAAEPRPLAAEAAGASHSSGKPKLTITELFGGLLASFAIVFITQAVFEAGLGSDVPEPRLFIRLVEARGLDPQPQCPCVALARVPSPVFELAVEADRVPDGKRGPCAGGGGATLRVSYRGVVLAWSSVPRFCVHSRSVASVVATAEGFVLREELRNLVRAELRALGRAEFDVDGEIPGLGGHLYCKTYLFEEDEHTHAPPPC